jgi:hypothetical protein
VDSVFTRLESKYLEILALNKHLKQPNHIANGGKGGADFDPKEKIMK